MSDIKLIHTQGLDEGIRCAMCTNVLANHKGCDGLCKVDEEMYKKVMSVIDKAFDKKPTTEIAKDCVSIEPIKKALSEMRTLINSPNRGNADYFIVDKIEEIINDLDIDNISISLIQTFEEQRWIPVNEGVPECHICEDGYVEPSEAVLVQLNNGSMETSRYWKGKTEPWIDLTYPTTLSVVAWRSLPQSYGEVQNAGVK